MSCNVQTHISSATKSLRQRLVDCVSVGYTDAMPTKDSGLRIRVQRDLRDRFLSVCQAQDKPAAQVVREFMREYVKKHSAAIDDKQTRKVIAPK